MVMLLNKSMRNTSRPRKNKSYPRPMGRPPKFESSSPNRRRVPQEIGDAIAHIVRKCNIQKAEFFRRAAAHSSM